MQIRVCTRHTALPRLRPPNSHTLPIPPGLHNKSSLASHAPCSSLPSGSIPVDPDLWPTPEFFKRVPRPFRADASVELLRRGHRLVPERHADVLDGRPVVLELLGEACPEHLVVRIDADAPEDLVSGHPPARVTVIAALLIGEKGLDTRWVDIELAQPSRPEVQVVQYERPHIGEQPDPLPVHGPGALALGVADRGGPPLEGEIPQ